MTCVLISLLLPICIGVQTSILLPSFSIIISGFHLPVSDHLFHTLTILFYTGMADLSDTSRWWFDCVRVCVSADMSPYCSAHDEWLIMKLCMYVGLLGYRDANNVSTFGGDPVTQLN